ncbi:unnamed protein product [Gadus morhua 'NCC']
MRGFTWTHSRTVQDSLGMQSPAKAASNWFLAVLCERNTNTEVFTRGLICMHHNNIKKQINSVVGWEAVEQEARRRICSAALHETQTNEGNASKGPEPSRRTTLHCCDPRQRGRNQHTEARRVAWSTDVELSFQLNSHHYLFFRAVEPGVTAGTVTVEAWALSQQTRYPPDGRWLRGPWVLGSAPSFVHHQGLVPSYGSQWAEACPDSPRKRATAWEACRWGPGWRGDQGGAPSLGESERCRRRGDPSVLSPRSSGASVNYSAPSHLSPDKTAPARRPDIPRGNCLSLLRAKHPHKERLCRTTTHGIRVRLCSNTLPLSRQPSGIPK